MASNCMPLQLMCAAMTTTTRSNACYTHKATLHMGADERSGVEFCFKQYTEAVEHLAHADTAPPASFHVHKHCLASQHEASSPQRHAHLTRRRHAMHAPTALESALQSRRMVKHGQEVMHFLSITRLTLRSTNTYSNWQKAGGHRHKSVHNFCTLSSKQWQPAYAAAFCTTPSPCGAHYVACQSAAAAMLERSMASTSHQFLLHSHKFLLHSQKQQRLYLMQAARSPAQQAQRCTTHRGSTT